MEDRGRVLYECCRKKRKWAWEVLQPMSQTSPWDGGQMWVLGLTGKNPRVSHRKVKVAIYSGIHTVSGSSQKVRSARVWRVVSYKNGNLIGCWAGELFQPFGEGTGFARRVTAHFWPFMVSLRTVLAPVEVLFSLLMYYSEFILRLKV